MNTNNLQQLQPYSGKSLKTSIIHGFHGHLRAHGHDPVKLVASKMISASNWTRIPQNGANSLSNPKNLQAIRKVMVLPAGREDNFIYSMNTALLGGESYPILMAILGTATGIVSFGAGLIFTVTSTALSVAQTSQRVLARGGDEIWQVEEIGKENKKIVHVNSYFIMDPFRAKAKHKGWLIHEERNEVSVG